jgi:hypothetical protein
MIPRTWKLGADSAPTEDAAAGRDSWLSPSPGVTKSKSAAWQARSEVIMMVNLNFGNAGLYTVLPFSGWLQYRQNHDGR